MASETKNWDLKKMGNVVHSEEPLSGANHLYVGWAVAVDTTGGYMLSGSDTDAGQTGVGICAAEVDNSTGAAGAKNVEFVSRGMVNVKMSGSHTLADRGRPVYVTNDADKMALSGATPLVNYVRVGDYWKPDPDETARAWIFVRAEAAGNDS